MAHPRVNPDYAMPWIRIWDNYTMLRPSKTQKLYTHTLFLDIFPIDGLPTNPKLSNLFFKKIRFAQK
jgi:phosphorylcholine metabolism protein LicD